MQIAKSVKRTNAFYSTNPFASIACYKLYGNAQKYAVEKKLQAIVRSKSVAYFTAHPKKSPGVASSSASQKVHTSHICASKMRLESANTHVREKERESEVVRASASIPTPPTPDCPLPSGRHWPFATGHASATCRTPVAPSQSVHATQPALTNPAQLAAPVGRQKLQLDLDSASDCATTLTHVAGACVGRQSPTSTPASRPAQSPRAVDVGCAVGVAVAANAATQPPPGQG